MRFRRARTSSTLARVSSDSTTIRWVPHADLAARQRASGMLRAIWAQHDQYHVLVFQAFRPAIGRAAAAAGTLAVPGFELDRTTWIKPSFLWMMHRSDWGRAQGQDVVLGLQVDRTWFEGALGQAGLSSARDAGPRPRTAHEKVVVQWDPDWDAADHRQPWRAIQIGLRPGAVRGYLSAIVGCVDLSQRVAEACRAREGAGAVLVPDADVLHLLDPRTRERLGVDGNG
jgi:hypothetical protein